MREGLSGLFNVELGNGILKSVGLLKLFNVGLGLGDVLWYC